LWRLEPGSRRFRPYLRPERPTDTFDFAARSTFGEGIALDRYGGLLAVGAIKRELPVVRGALRYVANGPTPWTMVALRSTRMSRRGVTAVIEATKPGTATLEIARDDRIIARDTRPVAAGHATLHAVGPIRSDWYDVRLQLQGADGAIARDAVPIHGAPALTVRLARRLLWRRQGSDDSGFYSLGRDCQRFGQRRVDCSITTDPGRNIGVASITLERSGVVLRRHYLWGRSGFRRHPRFIASDGVQRLSRDDRGRWASD
jgi:hypothetical protein